MMKRSDRPSMGAATAMLAAAAALATLSAQAQSPQAPSAARPVAPADASSSLDCMIQPHQVVQVGVPAAGVIEKILVDRGESVKAGQPLVQLQANVERASLAVARERAAQEGEIKVAAGSSELAQRELQRAKELREDNFVSQTFLDKSKAEAQVAGGRTDQASERRRLSQREVQLASAQLAQRTVSSPINGVVVERFMSPGEFVDQKPVLRIAAIDPLRVDVLVPAVHFGRIDVGMKGIVTPELLNTKPHTAVVKTVDRVIDAATNTFRVRLELPNPKHELPAGLRCKTDLGLKPPVAAGAPLGVTPGAAAVSPAPAVVAKR
jgi:membrane fusion protein, heavy metal efflux system